MIVFQLKFSILDLWSCTQPPAVWLVDWEGVGIGAGVCTGESVGVALAQESVAGVGVGAGAGVGEGIGTGVDSGVRASEGKGVGAGVGACIAAEDIRVVEVHTKPLSQSPPVPQQGPLRTLTSVLSSVLVHKHMLRSAHHAIASE